MTTFRFDADAASLPETLKLHHATKAKAQRLASAFEADWQALSLHVVCNEDLSQAASWDVLHTDEDGEVLTLIESSRVPDLADVLDACEEEGLDPEAGSEKDDEDGEKASGSVVREVYRQRYKEASSTGQSCGDWLAEWLAGETLDADGKADTDALWSLFNHNGLDLTAKWAQTVGSKGWQGRFRMNGRQVLEKTVALTGQLFDSAGREQEVDASWLEWARGKHAAWIAKQRKREAAEKAAAEAEKAEALEGAEAEDEAEVLAAGEAQEGAVS